MRLIVELDPAALLRWHLDLLRRVQGLDGVSVEIRWVPSETEPLPTCVEILFSLEQVLHGLRPGLAASADPSDLKATILSDEAGSATVLDLTDREAGAHDAGAPSPGGPRWHVTYDGEPGHRAAIAAIVAGRTPVVQVLEGASGRVLAAGHPGTDEPHVVVATFESTLARTTTLILAAIRGRGRSFPQAETATLLSCRAILRHGTRATARAVIHRIYKLLYRSPHWRVGWRFTDGPGVIDLGRHPETGWRDLADDGSRFYADPFPIEVGGRHWLFVEDLPHSTQKGIISAVAFDASGPVGSPKPVLELPCHLSYPFVFEAEGEIWMVPETSSIRRIELYRARRFPEDWVREATLVDDLDASDATLFRHAGRWWMSASVKDGDAGSCSDTLYLWRADDVRGPWTPHPANPVLVDVASARPAGRVEERDGRLIRPVQDCRGGYGSAVALAEIVRLDEEAFEQRVTARITAGPLWPGRRIHTLNRAGRLECIDGSALSPRWRRSSIPG